MIPVAALTLMLTSVGPNDLLVRASQAYAPCLAPALTGWRTPGGGRAILDVAEPTGIEGIDLVVGDDTELTHLLESGALQRETDLGYLPWVLVLPPGESSASSLALHTVVVLGGSISREVRLALSPSAPSLRPSLDEAELRTASRRAVPSSLAQGEAHQIVRLAVRPLVATAAVVRASAKAKDAERLLEFLGSRGSRLSGCLAPAPQANIAQAQAQGAYAQRVADWWVPGCSLRRNVHNDPGTVVGPPDAVRIGEDRFNGMFSLGQGGWVVVDAGVTIVDGPGADVRVYQTTSGEAVTLYAADTAQGPFTLVGLQEYCGVRSPGMFSNHCDFDLRNAGLTTARFLRIEDGEIWPCLAAETASEGADIDAIAILNFR
jgi:hypothetical protein